MLPPGKTCWHLSHCLVPMKDICLKTDSKVFISHMSHDVAVEGGVADALPALSALRFFTSGRPVLPYTRLEETLNAVQASPVKCSAAWLHQSLSRFEVYCVTSEWALLNRAVAVFKTEVVLLASSRAKVFTLLQTLASPSRSYLSHCTFSHQSSLNCTKGSTCVTDCCRRLPLQYFRQGNPSWS